MSLPVFLKLLFDHGRVPAPPFAPIAEGELAAARTVLTEFEAAYRRALPGEPPEFLVATAVWSAVVLYRACQCLVYRELEVTQALPARPTPGSGPRDAAQHYSVDVVLRFLPDVWRLSRDVACGDPLVAYLQELASAWPLSSVGMPDIQVSELDVVANHRSLLALYVDRILERQDHSRLADVRVRAAARCAIGLYSDLAPTLARKLEPAAAAQDNQPGN